MSFLFLLLALFSVFVRRLRLFSVRALRQAFENEFAFFSHSAVSITSFQKTSAWISLVAYLRGIDVSVQALSRPAIPCNPVCSCDQFARSHGPFISEHGTVYAGFARIADEFAPYEEGSSIGGKQDHLFTRPDELKNLSPFSRSVVAHEHRHSSGVSIFDVNPRAISEKKRLLWHSRSIA